VQHTARIVPEPANPFDPAHFAGLRKPYTEAETLPAWCYTSEAVYQRELERIFRRNWICLGHESQAAAPGDYFPFELAAVPLIIARDLDGTLHAFVNQCRHRGSRIVEQRGHGRFLKCPYHAWAYGLDGKLAGTPLIEEDAGFVKADYPLLEVRLDLWAGLIWVNLEPDAPSLMDYLGDLPERCAPWRPEDMVCTYRKEYAIAANWKLYYENFNESYHLPFVHQGTLNKQYVPGRALYSDARVRGEYIAHFTKHKGSRGVMDGEAGFDRMAWLPDRPEHEGTFYPSVNPNVMLGLTIDSAWVMELHPHAVDRTTLVFSMLFPRDTVARPDFAALAPKYYERFDITLPEDVRAAELQHQGLRSPISAPGRFTVMEQLVLAFDRWWADRMIAN
jgi:phenylpropionate dioxygenase-like ring-hydroxylating dioxygenase large terminal subunit